MNGLELKFQADTHARDLLRAESESLDLYNCTPSTQDGAMRGICPTPRTQCRGVVSSCVWALTLAPASQSSWTIGAWSCCAARWSAVYLRTRETAGRHDTHCLKRRLSLIWEKEGREPDAKRNYPEQDLKWNKRHGGYYGGGTLYADHARWKRAEWALSSIACGCRQVCLPVFAPLVHVCPQRQQLARGSLLTDRRRQVQRGLADIVGDRRRRSVLDQAAHQRGVSHACGGLWEGSGLVSTPPLSISLTNTDAPPPFPTLVPHLSRRVAPAEFPALGAATCGKMKRSVIVLVSPERVLASRQCFGQRLGVSSFSSAMQR